MTGDLVPHESLWPKNLGAAAKTALNGQQPTGTARTRSTRLTVNLPKELVDRLRDTVYWIPQLTLSRLVEEAIDSSLVQLEIANRGRFPRRVKELKPGRPRSARQAGQTGPSSQSRSPIRSFSHRLPGRPSLDPVHEGQHDGRR